MDKDLYDASLNALKICMALKESEKFLVVCDEPEREIGLALFQASQDLGAESVFVEIPKMKVNGEEPPEVVSRLMTQMDAVICPTSRSLTHTDARRNACAANARVATMPGIQYETMIRGMSADYNRIAVLSDKITEILTNGKMAHLTTAKGTDMIMPINGIEAISSRGLVINDEKKKSREEKITITKAVTIIVFFLMVAILSWIYSISRTMLHHPIVATPTWIGSNVSASDVSKSTWV